jgi:8-oxo-dGTP pyrophosphatase MutT (NUDIX family)
MSVLLTQRTAHLSAHAGQISFPGGRIELEDLDAITAALRETEEEVGLPRERVSVIGRLDTYVTGTGFEITPIVGIVAPPFALAIDPFEVAEAFEVPLAFILDRRNHQRIERPVGAQSRSFFVLPFEGRNIWGATAGILVNLAEVLAD